MSIEEVNAHIFDLLDSTNRVFGGEKQNKDSLNSFHKVRIKSLHILANLSERLKEMSDEDLSEIEKKYFQKTSILVLDQRPTSRCLNSCRTNNFLEKNSW